MALVTLPLAQPNYTSGISDEEFDEELRDAIEASNDDFAFRLQVQEILQLSNYTFALDLQLCEIQGASQSASASASSSDPCASSGAVDFDEVYGEDQVLSNRETGKKIVESCSLSQERVYTMPLSLPGELCAICFETEDPTKMFEGIRCLHRFCYGCITRYIHSKLEEKKQHIYCPETSCGEPLMPVECSYFLPAEIFEEWSSTLVEAQIPESDRVYCPFSDCSAFLVKENVAGIDVEDIKSAECPFCNRLFCVQCGVPWHANLNCFEYQNRLPGKSTEEDSLLLRLAEEKRWQRCGKCKQMIELVYGCNHMTCRCGHQFCYACGSDWGNGNPTCGCPRTSIDNILVHR